VTVIAVANQKGGVGKTTTAINVGVLLARGARRVLLVDSDAQATLTRQFGIDMQAVAVSLVEVLAGRASAADAIVADVHGVDVLPGARDLAGVEMSLVGEMARERFLEDALRRLFGVYDEVVIDTPPNLGLLTVNALACADRVLAPVSCEDEASVYGLHELQLTISRLVDRLGTIAPELHVVLTRWQPWRRSARVIEEALAARDCWPAARIRSRSAPLAEATARQVPLAVSAPDNAVTLGYLTLADELAGVTAR
jgi:chromosome partitioning protein